MKRWVLVGPSFAQEPLVRFILVGIFVLAVENAVVWVLMRSIDSYILVRSLSTVVALCLSYGLNTAFSFNATYSIRRFVSYTAGVALSLLVTYLVSLGFYYLILGSSHPLLATNVGAVFAAVTNYLYQRCITYAKKDERHGLSKTTSLRRQP